MNNNHSHPLVNEHRNQPMPLFTQWILGVVLLTLSSLSLANKIDIRTDRQTIEMGDIITLNIETDFQTRGNSLDLTLLRDQFEVLNQQQSNQVEIINGRFKSFTRWRLQLLPKQTGTLMIPPFKIEGVSSKPYPIKVLDVAVDAKDRPYFLEASVDKTHIYVQEQVIYSLRFYHKGSLINGNIRPPKFDGALLEQIKDQSIYGKTLNGKNYTVYEWKYAFFPQSSGQFDLPGPSFSGLLHLRGNQKGVRAVAKPISIEVKPKPDSVTEYWLPANAVDIQQQWPNLPKTPRIGDSLKRVITLQVDGLTKSQLPEIHTENGANFKVYPDASHASQTVTTNGVNSEMVITQAVVPTQEGTLHIPDLVVHWWNTQTHRIEKTVVNTAPITILPANQRIPPVTTPAPETSAKLPSLPVPNQPNHGPLSSQENTQSLYGWPVAVVMSLLWLITMVFWLRARRDIKALQQQTNHPDHDRAPTNKAVTFQSSWCDMPPTRFYSELLRQLHQEFGIDQVDLIPNPKLVVSIHQLEAHLFGEQPLDSDTLETICRRWEKWVKQVNQSAPVGTSNKTELANLYNR